MKPPCPFLWEEIHLTTFLAWLSYTVAFRVIIAKIAYPAVSTATASLLPLKHNIVLEIKSDEFWILTAHIHPPSNSALTNLLQSYWFFNNCIFSKIPNIRKKSWIALKVMNYCATYTFTQVGLNSQNLYTVNIPQKNGNMIGLAHLNNVIQQPLVSIFHLQT